MLQNPTKYLVNTGFYEKSHKQQHEYLNKVYETIETLKAKLETLAMQQSEEQEIIERIAWWGEVAAIIKSQFFCC